MSKKNYVFIDAEYCFTCAVREGMLPNYKAIIRLLDARHPDSIKVAYFVGSKERKKTVQSYLLNNGIDFVSILEMHRCSKTQIVGATMALDSAKVLYEEGAEIDRFVYLTGDDYMIPIIQWLHGKGQKSMIYAFSYILSKDLERMIKSERFPYRETAGIKELPNSLFYFGPDKDGN